MIDFHKIRTNVKKPFENGRQCWWWQRQLRRWRRWRWQGNKFQTIFQLTPLQICYNSVNRMVRKRMKTMLMRFKNFCLLRRKHEVRTLTAKKATNGNCIQHYSKYAQNFLNCVFFSRWSVSFQPILSHINATQPENTGCNLLANVFFYVVCMRPVHYAKAKRQKKNRKKS